MKLRILALKEKMDVHHLQRQIQPLQLFPISSLEKNLSFLLVLWEIHKTWWIRLTPSQFLAISLPTQFCVYSLKLILQNKIVLPKYSWMWGLLLESSQLTMGYIFRENFPSLSQQLPMTNSSTTWVCPTPISMAEFWLSLALSTCCHNCCEIVCAAIMLHLENSVSLKSSTASGSYALSCLPFFYRDLWALGSGS